MDLGEIIGIGNTAEIFSFGNDKVIKLFRKGIPKSMVVQEYELSLKIQNQLEFIPKVYDLKIIDGRCGIVYEKIEGKSMLKEFIKPWKRRTLTREFAELHRAIHQTVEFQLPRYKDILKDNISRTNLLSENKKNIIYKYIDNLSDGNKLCHGDFHPDNILLTEKSKVVIDWMTASIGDPLADVARTSLIIRLGIPSSVPPMVMKIIRNFQEKFYLIYINYYIKISAARKEDIEKWELPILAARLSEWVSQEEKESMMKLIDEKLEMLK